MESKIKRGLGIVTDLEISSFSIKGNNKLLIEGAYQEISIDNNLTYKNELKNNINTSFDKEHYDNCDFKLFEVKGNVIINQDIEQPTQLILSIETDSNIELIVRGKTSTFLSSGITIHAHKDITSNIKIKFELEGNQNYLKLNQKIESGANVNLCLQVYSKNQTQLLFKTDMLGENSSLDKRVFIKAENSKVDSEVLVNLKAPKTKANMVVNGTIKNSELINENTIFIPETSGKCEGYEHSKFILLDEKSTAVSIPNLKIFNNDVACSHGSTISSVGENELFYLQARGLSRDKSEMLIIDGLEESVLEHIKIILN